MRSSNTLHDQTRMTYTLNLFHRQKLKISVFNLIALQTKQILVLFRLFQIFKNNLFYISMLLSNEFDPTTYRNKTKFEVQNLKTPKKQQRPNPTQTQENPRTKLMKEHTLKG